MMLIINNLHIHTTNVSADTIQKRVSSNLAAPTIFSNISLPVPIIGARIYAGFAADPLQNCYGHVFLVTALKTLAWSRFTLFLP